MIEAVFLGANQSQISSRKYIRIFYQLIKTIIKISLIIHDVLAVNSKVITALSDVPDIQLNNHTCHELFQSLGTKSKSPDL